MDLTQLIDLYRGPLTGLIASWGAPWHDAAEIAQDSFAEAYLSRDSCRGLWSEPEVFGPWLSGVARNRYRNWARSHKRRRNHVVTVESTSLESVAAPSDPQPDPQLEKLRSAIKQLPLKQRQVVLMHYLEETSVKEVAILLSLTEKTVEGRLYQARRTLRRMLEGKVSISQIGRMLLCL